MDETFNKEFNMRINLNKSIVMECRRENRTRIQIKIQGSQILKQVDEFTYLGCTISNDGRNRSEIIKCIC